MSKSQLQVVFDREDRLYHFCEKISGKVILDALDKVTCRRVWIEYGWRTHGKGNPDKGEKNILKLQWEDEHLLKGGHKIFPFWFTAPNGPVTYHGVNINVDWYATAHADIPLSQDVEHEEDFLLLPSESPAVIILGDSRLSKIQSPARRRSVQTAIAFPYAHQIDQASTEPVSSILRMQFFVAAVLALGLFGFLLYLRLGILALLISVVAGMLINAGMRIILIAISKRKLGINEIRIDPKEVYTGEKLTCHLQFTTKGAVYLDSIGAVLAAEEETVRGSGTQTITHMHTAFQQSFTQPYGEKLMAGRWIAFECRFPIPPTAPATFIAKNNKIKWSIKIRVSLRRWPSWEKIMPVIVLPG